MEYLQHLAVKPRCLSVGAASGSIPVKRRITCLPKAVLVGVADAQSVLYSFLETLDCSVLCRGKLFVSPSRPFKTSFTKFLLLPRRSCTAIEEIDALKL